jgi:carbamoyltransferase
MLQEERFSREKNHVGYPFGAIDSALDLAAINRNEVEGVAFASSEVPSRYFYSALEPGRRFRHRMRNFRRDLRALLLGPERRKDSLVHLDQIQIDLEKHGRTVSDCFDAKSFYRRNRFPGIPVHFINHHLAHAETAFYFSGFERCLVVTADGSGDGLSHGSWDADLTHITPISQTPTGASPGYFYGDVTTVLGFKMMRHEGKITGLAAYGDPLRQYEAMRRAFRLSEDGICFVSDFQEEPGRRRIYLADLARKCTREDMAAAAQQALEDAMTEHIRILLRKTGHKRVALSGGVFANVKLNQRIMELPEVEEIFVFPGMGDEGLSAGAILSVLRNHSGRNYRPCRLSDVYWGPAFTNGTVSSLLDRLGCAYERLKEEDRAGRIAEMIKAGKVVGLFQGKMEFGPRALGNRSILAAPTDKTINDWLNQRLDRSEFMPFAPSVLAEFGDSLFENFGKGASTARFMTVTYKVRDEWADRIPAVVHIDRTCRPQMVHSLENPRYYEIIKAYYELTGIPLVLNTSFNVHEEPIICRPEEALRALAEKRVDALVIEDFLVTGRSPK